MVLNMLSQFLKITFDQVLGNVTQIGQITRLPRLLDLFDPVLKNLTQTGQITRSPRFFDLFNPVQKT